MTKRDVAHEGWLGLPELALPSRLGPVVGVNGLESRQHGPKRRGITVPVSGCGPSVRVRLAVGCAHHDMAVARTSATGLCVWTPIEPRVELMWHYVRIRRCLGPRRHR